MYGSGMTVSVRNVMTCFVIITKRASYRFDLSESRGGSTVRKFIFSNSVIKCYRSFSLSRNKKLSKSLRSLWPTVSELFAEMFHAPL